jgi:hypothetical protein
VQNKYMVTAQDLFVLSLCTLPFDDDFDYFNVQWAILLFLCDECYKHSRSSNFNSAEPV